MNAEHTPLIQQSFSFGNSSSRLHNIFNLVVQIQPVISESQEVGRKSHHVGEPCSICSTFYTQADIDLSFKQAKSPHLNLHIHLNLPFPYNRTGSPPVRHRRMGGLVSGPVRPSEALPRHDRANLAVMTTNHTFLSGQLSPAANSFLEETH